MSYLPDKRQQYKEVHMTNLYEVHHFIMHQSIESPGGGGGREMAGRCRAYPV